MQDVSVFLSWLLSPVYLWQELTEAKKMEQNMTNAVVNWSKLTNNWPI